MNRQKLYSSQEVLAKLQEKGDSLTRAQLHHLAHGTKSKTSAPILHKEIHYVKIGNFTFYTDAGIQRILHRKQHRKPYTRTKSAPKKLSEKSDTV